MIPHLFSRRFLALFIVPILAAAAPARIVHAGPESPAPSPAAWLGIGAQEMTPELRESMDLPATGGVLVGQVFADSPAEGAGIEEGDVILELDGKTMDSARALRQEIGAMSPDHDLKIRLVHEGKERVLTVKLGARPDEMSLPAMPGRGSARIPPIPGMAGIPVPPMAFAGGGPGPRLGVRVQPLNADLAGYFGVDADGGVLVLDVMPDSPAAKSGLKAGDVIREVDGNQVSTPEELVKRIRNVDDGKDVRLTVRRKGHDMSVTAKPETIEMMHPGPMPREIRIAPGPGGSGGGGPCREGGRERDYDPGILGGSADR